MANMSSHCIQENSENLELIYEGQRNRDASSKIRGFLFQDLVALEYLLEEDTDAVVLEYIEDVSVFRKDNSMLYVQAKYYPATNVKFKEIIPDLYYQYLCMELLEEKRSRIPVLAVHHHPLVVKPCLTDIEGDIVSAVSSKKSPEEPSEVSFQSNKPKFPDNPRQWFKTEVSRLTEKIEQERKLFQNYAYQDSIAKFHNDLKIENRDAIIDYEKQIAVKLKDLLHSHHCDPSFRRKNLPDLLIGVGLQSIRKRYTILSNPPKLNQIIVYKNDFIDDMIHTLEPDNELKLSGYLRGLLARTYGEILERNPDLDEDLQQLLGKACYHTQEWICKLVETPQGQFQLINTVSREMSEDLLDFREQSFGDRFTLIVESAEGIKKLCKYLWKIMLDICIENPPDRLEEYQKLLDPQTYVQKNGYDYICLKFDPDYADYGVILPEVGNDETEHNITTYYNRFTEMGDQRPQKWYLRSDLRGAYTYQINPARMSEEQSVADMNYDDTFFVECMQCIHIDDRQWNTTEQCSNCIFKKECIHAPDISTKEVKS